MRAIVSHLVAASPALAAFACRFACDASSRGASSYGSASAFAATEAIIDEIEALCPGAFYRTLTAPENRLKA